MKKGIILAAVLLGVFSSTVLAQAPQPLPADPEVRIGVLKNGLTYYIRHNERPKNRAEFHIAQKVGSMQEEDSQRGLAHFLEHMAFNGTTHYPGKAMLEYLESIGAKFGTNVNAYTSFDETVYTLMDIPVTRPGVIDSCLLVLYDWSCGILLEDDEIDSERGVIHEEWRTGQGAQMRVWDQVLPVIFAESRYAHRLPIGLMEVVDHFPYQVIRDYYDKWYRPDLQGIVIVGDVDVDYVEAKIQAMFSDIELPENPAERIYYGVPDTDKLIVAMAKDKELNNVRTSINYKHEPLPREMRNTANAYIKGYMDLMVRNMLNARLTELVQKPQPPFLQAGVNDGKLLGLSASKDAFSAIVISDEDHIEEGFRALVREVQRAVQHGFTASEYERARANFQTAIENAYNEREKQRNSSYTSEYTRAFLDGEAMPGIELEYSLYNQFVPVLPVEAINEYMKQLVTDENIIIMMQGPDKEGIVYPSKEELIALFETVSAEPTEPYVEEVSNEPLVATLPAPGKIVKTETDKLFGATVWTLSNGAKVVVKPTAFKNDQILMSGFAPGGYSLIGDEYNRELHFFNSVAGLGGLGNFSAVNLRKALAGKNAAVQSSVGELSQSVSGSCSPRDLETMMQLLYLRFTGIRADEDAFGSWKTRQIASLRNQLADPNYIYQDSLYSTMYGHNPRMAFPTVEDVESFSYEKALDLYRERFADAGGFTFLFVGNVDEESLKPYVEQYVASLPGTRKNVKAGEPIRRVKGEVTNVFDQKMESPKVSVILALSEAVEPTLKHFIAVDMIGQVLTSRYTETMREEEGGTYSPGAQASLSNAKKEATVLVVFDTNAEQYERLTEIAVDEIERLAAEGPSDADFNKVKEYLLKKYNESLQENGYWLGSMNLYYQYGQDYTSQFAETVNALTKRDIQHMAKRILDSGNIINVTMNGVAAE